MKEKLIAIGSDHAGFDLKERLKQEIEKMGYRVIDFGTDSSSSCDYPDFARPVAEAVRKGKAEKGVLVCGTGVGMSIVANKIPGVRAALCNDITCAKYARAHNDANVITMGGRLLKEDEALSILRMFLDTEFEGDARSGGERHRRRLAKVDELEKHYFKRNT
ncbi:MAG: ribose 5-phosphate isomerase B [Actinomycetota bacterium]|nr:ribose 5-phosphate isomerase B [Actinomycetota bacterium]